MHVLGRGADLVVGETAEGVRDELEVVVEVGRPGAVLGALVRERFEEGGRPVLGDEVVRGREVGGVDAPQHLPADEPRGDVGDRVGDESTRQHRLDLAVLGVAAHDPPGLDRGRGVREVVGDHLVLVQLRDGELPVGEALVREVRHRAFDEGRRQLDRDVRRPFLIAAHARTIPTGRPGGRMREWALRSGRGGPGPPLAVVGGRVRRGGRRGGRLRGGRHGDGRRHGRHDDGGRRGLDGRRLGGPGVGHRHGRPRRRARS